MSLDELLILSATKPMYWGAIHPDAETPIVIDSITWKTATHFAYASILFNESDRIILSKEDLPVVRTLSMEMYINQLVQECIGLIERACVVLIEQSPRFRQQLADTAGSKLSAKDSIGIPAIDKILNQQNIFPEIIQHLRQIPLDLDLDYMDLREAGISFSTNYNFEFGGMRFSNIKEFVVYHLCKILNPRFARTQPEITVDFEQTQAYFFDIAVFNSLNYYISLKIENKDVYDRLQLIPINFRVVDNGFLGAYIDNHTRNLLLSHKKNHNTGEIHDWLFSNKTSIFYQWTTLFQNPSLIRALTVVDNFLKVEMDADHVLLFMTTMLSQCGWRIVRNVPREYVRSIKQPIEIARILWGFTCYNLDRLQNQPFSDLTEFMRAVKLKVSKELELEQIAESITKGVELFSRLEDTGMYSPEYLKQSIILCGVRVNDADYSNHPTLLRKIQNRLDISERDAQEIVNISNHLYKNQARLSDQTRARLALFS